MHIPWLAQEYGRTCDDCGHAWRVPRWAAHPRMQGLLVGSLATSGMEREPLPRKPADVVVRANAKLAERAEAFRRCPECDSDHYRQRSIRS